MKRKGFFFFIYQWTQDNQALDARRKDHKEYKIMITAQVK